MRILIYGDEGGTMPLKDDDPPFVAVSIITSTPPASFRRPVPRSPTAFLKLLEELHAVPFVSRVVPFAGYGQRLENKLFLANGIYEETIKRAASWGEELDVRHKNPRNWVWEHTMTNALGISLMKGFLVAPIDSIEFILNEKTFGPGERQGFQSFAVSAREILLRRVVQFEQEHGGAMSTLAENVRSSNPTVSFLWATNRDGGHPGLELAHRLAQQSWRQLAGKPNATLLTELAKLEHRLGPLCADATELLLRELSSDSIAEWAKKEG